MDILISVVFAVFFAFILTGLFRREGPGPMSGLLYFFLMIFFFSWAIGAWLTPVGPVFNGVAWLGYLIIAFLIMMMIAALAPPRTEEEAKPVAPIVAITFGWFFWITLISLLIFGLTAIIA